MDGTEEWVSLREFARRQGVAANAVTKALANGRIVRRDDKKIHWPTQSKAWEQLRDLGKVRDDDEGGEEPTSSEFQLAKTRISVANAGLREIELKEALGELIKASHARGAMTQFAIDVREAVMTIPERTANEVSAEIAAVCEGAAIDRIQEIVAKVLRRESRHVLEMISRVADQC